MTELSDKVLLEPYVWKRTRTVLKRVRTSNRPILSNASPHPHKKNIDTNPLKCAINPRLKEAGEFLHNKVKSGLSVFSVKKIVKKELNKFYSALISMSKVMWSIVALSPDLMV